MPRSDCNRPHTGADLPTGVFHDDLSRADAAARFDPHGGSENADAAGGYMPDEITRDCARRMHYALYRARQSRSAAAARQWQQHFFRWRDAIIVGNRKLVYSAVGQKMHLAHHMDDMIGECSLVLIRAVAAYNPWLGIRFSTYAFTCLIRALARLNQRFASDRLERCFPLDVLLDDRAERAQREPRRGSTLQRLDELLSPADVLLSEREKAVLLRRYGLTDQVDKPTLEQVGRELGISKERVRQVQANALAKLRQALALPTLGNAPNKQA